MLENTLNCLINIDWRYWVIAVIMIAGIYWVNKIK